MDYLSIYNHLAYISIVLYLVFGCFTMFNLKKNPIYWKMALFFFNFALYSLSLYKLVLEQDTEIARRWLQLFSLFGPLTPISLYLFLMGTVDDNKRDQEEKRIRDFFFSFNLISTIKKYLDKKVNLFRKQEKLQYKTTKFFLLIDLICINGFVYKGMFCEITHENGWTYTTPSIFIYPFFVFYIFMFSYAIYILYRTREIEQSKGNKWSFYGLFIFAFICALVGAQDNLFLTRKIGHFPFSSIAGLVYLVFLYYIINIRRLIDINKQAEMIESLAHELKTHITIFKSHAEYLRKKVDGTEDIKLAIGTILRESEQFSVFVDNIQDTVELDATGVISLNIKDMYLQKVVAESLSFFEPLFKEKNIKYIFSPPNLPMVKADYNKLKQVIVNLLNNSIKYTKRDGSIEIQMEHIDSNNLIRAIISDTGIGISDEDLSKIFKIRYFRTKQAKKFGTGGAGLGLKICKQIIEQHGGKIWAENKEGKGSNFFFTLPCANSK